MPAYTGRRHRVGAAGPWEGEVAMGTELGRLGNYRVGDAERSRTVELLKEAHVAGYLTLADIDERLSSALEARTRDDLERLLADLPPEWRSRQLPQPAVPQPAVARGHGAAPVLMRLLPLVVLVVLVGVVVLSLTRGFF